MAINYEQVSQAIEGILETQGKYTLQDIREKLGHRGSMSTISKYAQQWREQHFISSSSNSQTGHKHPAPESIMEAVTSVWQNMSDQSREEVQEKERQIEKITSALEDEIRTLQQDSEQVRAILAQKEQKNLSLEDSLNSSLEKNQSYEKNEAILLQKISSLQSQHREQGKILDKSLASLEESFKATCANIKEQSDQQEKQLKEQIAHLMSLCEEQRIESLKRQELLLREVETLKTQLGRQDFAKQLYGKIESLSGFYESLTKQQETLNTVQTDILTKIDRKIKTAQYKALWCFSHSNEY